MARPSLTLTFKYNNKLFENARTGLQAVAKRMTGAPMGNLMAQAVAKEMLSFLSEVAGSLEQLHGTPWPGGTSDKTLSRRSGNALRAVRESIKLEIDGQDNVRGTIGGPFYLRTQEFGTKGAGGSLPDIVPVNGDWLTIPMPAALDGRGVPLKEKARDWSDTCFIRKKNPDGTTTLYIARRQKGSDHLVFLYRLAKKVAIPPRLGLGKILREGTPYFVDKATEKSLQALMDYVRTVGP
jgi:hypothetical protein